jgi:3-isopropylmalate/(R)-2-methylmalate dehydratase small subunit
MQDRRILSVTGTAVGLPGNEIDTDRIMPARYLRCVSFDGLGEHVFAGDREACTRIGEVHPFDDATRFEATVLFVNKNFGCGSSREHAPQGIKRWKKGIRAIVGESFGEIFFGNCLANGIPCLTADEPGIAKLLQAARDPKLEFRVDLETMTVTFGAESVPVTMPASARIALMQARWDATVELLQAKEQIAARAAKLPYFRNWAAQ